MNYYLCISDFQKLHSWTTIVHLGILKHKSSTFSHVYKIITMFVSTRHWGSPRFGIMLLSPSLKNTFLVFSRMLQLFCTTF